MPENKSLDQACYDRQAAAVTLHWHLCRAAAIVAHGLVLGESFDREMASAEIARKAWSEAQVAIINAEPPRGR